MLNFIGCGSAFNTALGNNSAYMKFDKTLFIIDCGSANFDRIKNSKLLKDINNIDVLITHLHPDHIGSLGDLIFYSYYSMNPMFNKKVRILIPNVLEVNLRVILQMQGITSNMCEFVSFNDFGLDDLGYNLRFMPIEVTHVKELECFGYLIFINDEITIYYSGDSNMIPDRILREIGEFDYFYQDTCKADYSGNVHLSLNRLCKLIPQQFRNKVYCMHLDETFSKNEAILFGFNVVSAL